MIHSDSEDMDERTALASRWSPTLTAFPQRQIAAASLGVDERRRMAKRGVAMPDGSFPIPDVEHLKSAIRLARTDAQRAHVTKRAKALGASNLIPQQWRKSS